MKRPITMNEPAMNFNQFFEAVGKMRHYQKAYFTEGRKPSDLAEAKVWEKVVDRGLKDGVELPPISTAEWLRERPDDVELDEVLSSQQSLWGWEKLMKENDNEETSTE